MSKYSQEDVNRGIKNCTSIAALMRELGISGGGSRAILIRRLTEWNVDTNHFTGQGWSKGKSSVTHENIRGERDPFKRDSTTATNKIRERIIRQNLIPYFCDVCTIDEWCGHALTLELDHVDGDNRNNELRNLRWLCPNCHSQTETYCGKNINKGKKHVTDVDFIETLNSSPNIRTALIRLGLTPKGANYARARHLLDLSNGG